MSSAAVIDHTQRDPWEVAIEQFDTAADKLHLDPNMRGIRSPAAATADTASTGVEYFTRGSRLLTVRTGVL